MTGLNHIGKCLDKVGWGGKKKELWCLQKFLKAVNSQIDSGSAGALATSLFSALLRHNTARLQKPRPGGMLKALQNIYF